MRDLTALTASVQTFGITMQASTPASVSVAMNLCAFTASD
jgi:hypothetical protein